MGGKEPRRALDSSTDGKTFLVDLFARFVIKGGGGSGGSGGSTCTLVVD